MCAPKGAKPEGSGNGAEYFMAVLQKLSAQLGDVPPKVAPLRDENEG